jgi:20S proteasome subunit beta 2
MASLLVEPPAAGFSFRNTSRNVALEAHGFVAPKAVKTGTTIAGLIYKDGVVLGADTRATAGNIVADKNCEKIHRIAPRIYCCGAGTAADTEMTTRSIESQIELLHLNTGREIPVVAANRLLKQQLFRYQGHIGAALVLGGVDRNGSHIYCIYPHGSTDKLPFATMGSGSLAAMAVMESRWKPELELDVAVDIMREAITAGITNDLGSGSNVDVMVISKDEPKGKLARPFRQVGLRGQRQGDYGFKRGATATLETRVIPLQVVEEPVEAMET